jgi:DNA-binding CsgD family transcriptional regulator
MALVARPWPRIAAECGYRPLPLPRGQLRAGPFLSRLGLGAADDGMESSVGRRNVSPRAVGRCVGELLAGPDAGEEAEHLAEAVGEAEPGGQGDDRDERDAVREVERVGHFPAGVPAGPVTRERGDGGEGECGEVHLDPAVARQLTASLRRGPSASPKDLLTEREREILALVAQGKANKEIAAELVISERTARTHVSNILSKLNLNSRTQAALWAVREGLAPPPA